MVKYRMVIVGMGSAGRSRFKNIEQHSQVELAGIVSRRPDVASITLDAALQDTTIDAVLICSENATHFEYAKMFLESGKHILVEFPLANTFAQVEALLQLAQQKNKILHLEVLGLLTQKHILAKQLFLQHQSHIKEIQYQFSGGLNDWIKKDMEQGYYGALCVSRLHALWDLVGPLQKQNHSCDKLQDGFSLKAQFKTQQNILINFTNIRYSDAPRKLNIEFMLQDGTIVYVLDVKDSGGLFYQDFEMFIEELEGKKKFLEDVTILEVMKVVDSLKW